MFKKKSLTWFSSFVGANKSFEKLSNIIMWIKYHQSLWYIREISLLKFCRTSYYFWIIIIIKLYTLTGCNLNVKLLHPVTGCFETEKKCFLLQFFDAVYVLYSRKTYVKILIKVDIFYTNFFFRSSYLQAKKKLLRAFKKFFVFMHFLSMLIISGQK